jgi:fructokinase
MTKKLFGGIEGGGTKFVCLVGTGPDEITAEAVIPTTTPQETLARVTAFFKDHQLASMGLASFGPVDLDPSSDNYGTINQTPKQGWAGTKILADIHERCKLPVAFELDVNAAAFGEYYWVPGNHDLKSMVYITIGTGIGAGLLINGTPVHGLTHPEAGHMRLPHDRKKDPFPGNCPFHKDCFEGLASGSALAKRWRRPANTLPLHHPAWGLEADYIALALVNIILTVSPHRIVLGGGVMEFPPLISMLRKRVSVLLNGYISPLSEPGSLEELIVRPQLGRRSGVLGALALAKNLVEKPAQFPRQQRRVQ